MRIRLIIFASLLILLPPLSLSLSAQDFPQDQILDGMILLPALAAMMTLVAIAFALDAHTLRRTGTSLLRTQTHYIIWLSFTGALLGETCAYLNIFSPLWISPLSRIDTIFLATLLGAALLPAILVLRLWIASWPSVLRSLSRLVALPSLPAEASASIIFMVALVGLLGGTVWPDRLNLLFWISPLLLMTSLQVLWHESTLFSGLIQGNWSRIILGAFSGILACGGMLILFKSMGGAIEFTTSSSSLTILFAVYGLLCLQLGDVIAEHWRGKNRSEIRPKKPFPIPVITKKD